MVGIARLRLGWAVVPGVGVRQRKGLCSLGVPPMGLLRAMAWRHHASFIDGHKEHSLVARGGVADH